MRGEHGQMLLLPEVPHQPIPRMKGFSMYLPYIRMVWGFMFQKSGGILQLKCIFHVLLGSRVC